MLLGILDSKGEALGLELGVSLGCVEGSVLGAAEFDGSELGIMLGFELGAFDGLLLGDEEDPPPSESLTGEQTVQNLIP